MAFGAFAPMPLRLGGSSEEGWTPEQHARLCADLVAAKRAAPLAVWTFTHTGLAVIIHSYFGQNGIGLAHAPNVSVGATGVSMFEWDTPMFADPYGVSHGFLARQAIVTVHETFACNGNCIINAATTAVVRTFDSTDGSLSACKATVVVW